MRRRVRLLAAIALVAACGDATGPAHDLASARRQWQRTRPAAYQLTLSVSCFCAFAAQPVVIDVRGDSVLSRRSATGLPLDPRLAGTFPTVDGLFAVIDSAMARHAQHLDVTYDPARGYPTRIGIDYSERVADDEISYAVVGFESRP